MKLGATVVVCLMFVAIAFAAEDKCHPQCKWQCDDPSCPAVCHPVCEKPKCEMRCEEVTCAKCTVHCAKPECTLRCPKDFCELTGCPTCEHVCKPAQCHTTCQAPEPKCSPVCEAPACQNKCIKPTNCARPKCELQCEKPACAAEEQKCCPCTSATTQIAIVQANNACNPSPCGNTPSFLEVYHSVQDRLQRGQEHCCPCQA